jgi:hypothetical protein
MVHTHPNSYPWTTLRLEYRPLHDLHSRQELLDILDTLADCGVDAWWYSAAAKTSIPLFKSKFLPYRDQPDPDLLPWLVGEAHRRNITLVSWEYLTTAPLLAEIHPEWRFRYLDDTTPHVPRDDHFVCLNSPYGELLKQYCVELVNDIGFDAIWFDGSYLFSDRTRKWACCCDYCGEKFKTDTGKSIPTHVDINDPLFRLFLKWRYRWFAEYWASLADFMHRHNPRALISINFFNRLGIGTLSGCQLIRHRIPAMINSESDWRPNQLSLQMKYLRAINDRFPPEIWTAGCDGTHVHKPNRPEPDPAPLQLYGYACMTAGGFPSFGAADDPQSCRNMLKSLSASFRPRAPYVGGRAIRCVGLVVSGNTLDFGHEGQSLPAWQSVHGMDYLLAGLRWPTEALLDDQLESCTELESFPAILLSDIRCLSDQAGRTLEEYVRNGGFLLATGQTGTMDEEGNPRPIGVLDNLFGIALRRSQTQPCLLTRVDSDLIRNDWPADFLISGNANFVHAAEGKILARGVVSTSSPGLDQANVAILDRKCDKGYALYLASNIGQGYALNPNRRSRLLIDRLLRRHLTPPFEVQAPSNVVVTGWHQNNRLVFHLFNQPVTMAILINEHIQHCPDEVSPTGPIVIQVPGKFSSTHCPTGGSIETRIQEAVTTITLPRLDLHEIIILDY